MMREDRQFGMIEVASKQDLQTRLLSGPWPLCTAFQLGDLVFVNSSKEGQEAQAFSVIHEDQLIEVLQVNTMTEQELAMALDWLVAGGGTFMGIVEPMLEPAGEHHCSRC